MLSMTGFGSANLHVPDGSISVQIASVNNRSFQVSVRSDVRDLHLEEQIKHAVRERLQRGSLTVHIAYASARALLIDTERLLGAWREMAELAQRLGAPTPALEQVASLQSCARANREPPFERHVLAAVDEALGGVVEMRRREGRALVESFRGHAAWLRKLCTAMNETAHGRVGRYHEHLLERLRTVLANHPISDEILVRELALYSDRIDVSEEIVRFASHLDGLDLLLSGREEAVGRKLEFLLQEFGREINTIGSKANDAALTKLVLEAKSVVEQMKEQAANVA
jgi:uncharacterized protein (TIGR00255 family)